MNLLQTFHTSRFKRVEQSAFKQRVCFFTALTINSIVAVSEPVKKLDGTIVGIMFGKKDNAIAIQKICLALFSIRSLEFEPVSGTHELNAVLCNFRLSQRQ